MGSWYFTVCTSPVAVRVTSSGYTVATCSAIKP
jgi:hypothetical protein